MPSALVTTIGSASANSYVSLSDAITYFADRFGGDEWGGDEDPQTRALLTASRRLQDENWLGSRVDSTQALAWPRDGVQIVDTTGFEYGSAFQYYLTTEIPQRVKDAQCELALWLMAQNRAAGQSLRRVKSWSADGISATYEYGGAIETMPEEVTRLIGDLIVDVHIRRG